MIELKPIEETENKLLERKKLVLKITFDQATPTKVEVKKAIADKYKVKEDTIAIKSIYQEYGTTNAQVTAYLYNDAKALQEVERPPKKKASEAPAEAPKEEAKSEAKEAPEKKEEPKQEASKSEEKPTEENKEEAKE